MHRYIDRPRQRQAEAEICMHRLMGETGTDSKMHQQLSADRELQRLLAADRDSHREAGSCIQREILTETDRNRCRGRDTYS